jgi:5-formyltetrahydrofolate cyclo-ligase
MYAPIGAEVETVELERLATTAGKLVAYPCLVPGERALSYGGCASSALVGAALGTREPPPGAAVAVPDLVIVPGVAFDGAGRRLGRGRGHYDATLAALPERTVRIGVAFELQVVDAVPDEPHDARLDAVVTEARTLIPLTPRAGSGIPSRP